MSETQQTYFRIKFKRICLTLVIVVLITSVIDCGQKFYITSKNPLTKTFCLNLDNTNTLRAKHKACFLRADSGPCRSDIIQWYFDVKQKKCYRFFWGGCQGNGNKFESKKECMDYCLLVGQEIMQIPLYCNLAFSYGSCFGHFNRWAWDSLTKSCKRRIYSGCGGNQNNFHTPDECQANCLTAPNNTLSKINQFTTCLPLNVIDRQ